MSNLKDTRKIKGMTQKTLSEKSGVNLRTLQDYEQGSKDINKVAGITLYRLAQALDCNMEDLLEFDLITDDLSKPIDPELVPKLKKRYEQIKKEVEE